MDCVFCNKETVDKSFEYIFENSVPAKTFIFRVDYCNSCYAEYPYWGQKSEYPYAVNLYVTLHDKIYRWSYHFKNNIGRLWHINDPGFVGLTPNKNSKLLKTIKEDCPKVTPQNVKEKI